MQCIGWPQLAAAGKSDADFSEMPRKRGEKHRQLHLDWPPLFAILNPPGNNNSRKKLFELDPASPQGARDAIQ